MKDLILEKKNQKEHSRMHNIKTDMYIIYLNWLFKYKLITNDIQQNYSTVQQDTFKIIQLLNEYVHGRRKYPKQYIINQIMDFQSSLVIGDKLDVYKILEFRIFYKQFILKNDIYQDIYSTRQYSTQVEQMLDMIYNGISHDTYLNENEVLDVLLTKKPNKRK